MKDNKMPQATNNKVRLKFKTKSSFDEFKNKYLLKDEDGSYHVDFSLVIPSPKCKDYTVAPADLKLMLARALELMGKTAKSLIEILDKPHSHITDDAGIPLSNRQVAENSLMLMKETGEIDWYSWNLKHWGVYRNASNSIIEFDEKNLTIVEFFVTPWGAPKPIPVVLKKIFGDDVEIKHLAEYDDDKWHRIA